MNTSEWMLVLIALVGAVVNYLQQREQNQIFREQNRIFADQGGKIMLPEKPRFIWLKRYWPTLITVLLFLLIGYDIYTRHVAPPVVPWWFYAFLLLIVAAIGLVNGRRTRPQAASVPALPTEKPKEPSKLVIHSANYRAWQGGGNTYDVTEFLRKIISGDSLVFTIENHNFVVGDHNFVPVDPLSGKVKRLRVTYSYMGDPVSTIERSEHDRVVLPEDSQIKRLTDEITAAKQQQQQREVEELKARQIREGYATELRAAKERIATMEAQGFDSDRRYPRNIFTVQRVTADPPSISPGVFYKDKIRVILTNHLDRAVSVWTPMWQSLEVQCQQPLGSLLRQEGVKGWKADDWVPQEEESLSVPVGVTFSCWIGLLPPIGESIERRLQTHTSIGTATFPVKIDGKLYEVPINL